MRTVGLSNNAKLYPTLKLLSRDTPQSAYSRPWQIQIHTNLSFVMMYTLTI